MHQKAECIGGCAERPRGSGRRMLTINVAVLLAVIVFVRLRCRTEARSRMDEKVPLVLVLSRACCLH